MGDYWFKNKKTKKFTLKSMTISEMEKRKVKTVPIEEQYKLFEKDGEGLWKN